MSRLIDADALLRDMVTCCASTQFGRATAKMCIKRAPTVDAVEVVRCGECKYSKSSRTQTCRYRCDYTYSPCRGRCMDADFGCLCGERKDGVHPAGQNTPENAGKVHRDADGEAGENEYHL